MPAGRPSGARKLPSATQIRTADLLHRAREQERAGCIAEAKNCYRDAIAEAARTGEWAIEAEALRRVGALHHIHGQLAEAREACEQSHGIALRNADRVLAAEALNVRAIVEMDGDVEAAREMFLRALAMGGASVELRARVEQNLGILANMQGQLDEALLHYGCSLQAYREEELAQMKRNFWGFDPSFHVARYNFVCKVPRSRTPLYLARHRRAASSRTPEPADHGESAA